MNRGEQTSDMTNGRGEDGQRYGSIPKDEVAVFTPLFTNGSRTISQQGIQTFQRVREEGLAEISQFFSVAWRWVNQNENKSDISE